MSGGSADVAPRTTPLATIFGRLFESEFVTLERFAISRRGPGGIEYLDESTALARLLAGDDRGVASGAARPGDPSLHALHLAMHAAWPELGAAVSGRPLHLRALLAEGLALPAPTSMMRKRGITRLDDHLVEPGALDGARLDETLAAARETARRNGMKHVLLVVSDGWVHVAGSAPEETMAHWSNVEFAARVECMRIEEEAVRVARRGDDGPG